MLKNLKFSPTHEWVKIEENCIKVGITDYAQKELGDIVFVELPKKGEQINKNERLAVVESVKSVSEIFSPLSGKVVEINEELSKKPELINQDPYGKGWIAVLKTSSIADLDLAGLITYEEYQKNIR